MEFAKRVEQDTNNLSLFYTIKVKAYMNTGRKAACQVWQQHSKGKIN